MRPAEFLALAAGAAVGWAAAGREKPQGVRLVDVLLLGPLMVYVATIIDDAEELELSIPLTALTAAGAATITYNARNYRRLQGRAEPTSYMGPG